MKQKRIFLFTILMIIFVLFFGGCQNKKQDSLSALAIPAPGDWQEKLSTLPITWQNREKQSEKEETVFLLLEIYDQSDKNKHFLAEETQAWLSQTLFPISVIDYPLSQRSKSFMTAAISQCLVVEAPEKYPSYLRQTAMISGLPDDNIEMQALLKKMNLKYDNRCIAKNMRNYQKLFENKNPLQITELPLILYQGNFYPANKITPVDFFNFISEETK